jgi:hypothetical protein
MGTYRRVSTLTGTAGVFQKKRTPWFESRRFLEELSLETLSDKVNSLAADVSAIKSEIGPNIIDFTEVTSTGTAASPQEFSFVHGFGGPVSWQLIDLNSTSGTLTMATCSKSSSTTANVLVLNIAFTGTLTVRVEQIQ